MGLILSIATAASAALLIWRTLNKRGDTDSALHTVSEARRTAGIVNAISYAFAIILDAMAARRTITIGSPAAASSGPGRIGVRAGDIKE